MIPTPFFAEFGYGLDHAFRLLNYEIVSGAGWTLLVGGVLFCWQAAVETRLVGLRLVLGGILLLAGTMLYVVTYEGWGWRYYAFDWLYSLALTGAGFALLVGGVVVRWRNSGEMRRVGNGYVWAGVVSFIGGSLGTVMCDRDFSVLVTSVPSFALTGTVFNLPAGLLLRWRAPAETRKAGGRLILAGLAGLLVILLLLSGVAISQSRTK